MVTVSYRSMVGHTQITRTDPSSELVVLHAGAIGDFVLALAVIQPLRTWMKAGRVVAIASAASARLAAGRSAIDAHLWPEDVGLHTLFGEDMELDERLARLLSGADCVLSFLGGASSRVHQRMRAATTTPVVSLDPRPTRQTLANGQHITEQWCSAIRQAGFQIGEPTPPVIRVAPAGDLGGHARPWVIVHPGSGGRDKCWPIERFVEVAASLGDVHVTWLLGPAECERDARHRCAENLSNRCAENSSNRCAENSSNRCAENPFSARPVLDSYPAERLNGTTPGLLRGDSQDDGTEKGFSVQQTTPPARDPLDTRTEKGFSVQQLVQQTVQQMVLCVRDRVDGGDTVIVDKDLSVVAGLIAGADLYLGNDAGPTHLAAAMSIPTVVVFGPTDPRVWRPLGEHVRVVRPAQAGDSITKVSIEDVSGAVRQMLGGPR